MDKSSFNRILRNAARDRMLLAKEFLTSSGSMTQDSIGARNAISRSYYAMHHIGRAVIFAVRRVDITQHEKVPAELPDDLPNSSYWRERISFWHIKRNKVDYSVYLDEVDDLNTLRESACEEAREFLQTSLDYFKKRGLNDG